MQSPPPRRCRRTKAQRSRARVGGVAAVVRQKRWRPLRHDALHRPDAGAPAARETRGRRAGERSWSDRSRRPIPRRRPREMLSKIALGVQPAQDRGVPPIERRCTRTSRAARGRKARVERATGTDGRGLRAGARSDGPEAVGMGAEGAKTGKAGGEGKPLFRPLAEIPCGPARRRDPRARGAPDASSPGGQWTKGPASGRTRTNDGVRLVTGRRWRHRRIMWPPPLPLGRVIVTHLPRGHVAALRSSPASYASWSRRGPGPSMQLGDTPWPPGSHLRGSFGGYSPQLLTAHPRRGEAFTGCIIRLRLCPSRGAGALVLRESPSPHAGSSAFSGSCGVL